MHVAHTTNFMSTAVSSVIKLIIACLLITQINAHAGFVLGRGVITSENGETLWAEYNADGGYRILEDIKDNDAHTVAGLTLLAYQNQLQAYETRNPNAQYLTKAAFDAINITAQNGKAFNKPTIPEEAKVVVFPAIDKILTEHHEFIEYIWLPYDLKKMGGIASKGGQENVPEVSSYLIGKDGGILHESTDEGSSIGPLNGYYYPEDDNGNLVLEQKEYENGALPTWSNTSDKLINAVPGVEVWGAGNNRVITQGDGWISGNLTYCNPQPPGGYRYDPGTTISARLPFIGFNASEPKQRAYFAHGMAWGCDSVTSNIFVSMQSVMGDAQIFNPDAGIVPLTAKTSFHLDTQRNEATYLSNIDFDGDDIKDPASYLKYDETNNTYTPLEADAASEATHIGIYFTTGVETNSETNLAIPSIIRAVDRVAQHKHKGLLKTINTVDLAQTDLFVFRVSSGQLITSHKGIDQNTHDDNHTQGGTFPLNGKEGAFNFQFAMRGPDDYWNAFNPYPDYAGWASATKVTEPFQKRNADHIRPGEQLQLVAINRASGYIGSVKFTSKQVGVGGDINNALDTIIMRPPNLKIWAERVHEIKQGKQVAGEKESTNLIGNEGITLEDDLAVSIHTEWLDHNGLPLPVELGDFGYTARIAKVTSAPTPDVDALQQNSSNEFAIKPGRNLNVLQFNQKELSRHHFYVQVNPYPKSQQNDFGSDIYNPNHKNYLPDGSGTDEHELPSVENIDLEGTQTTQVNPLRYRPAHYVPFKVPLFDEQYSQIQQDVYDDLKEQNADNPSELAKLEKPDPLYRWYYRPELQFSQYNFDAKSLIVNQIDDEGTASTTEIEIEEDGTDFGPIFDDYTDSVELLFDLLGPELDRLPALENDREFVLSLGGEEAIATISADGKVVFNNPDHLTQLTEEDLLSLRLYLNGDAGNVLWEYAFNYLHLEAQLASYTSSTNTLYVSADDPVVPLQAVLLGYSDKGEKDKTPLRMQWQVAGKGALSTSSEINTSSGIFFNEVTLPNSTGSKATVSAKLIDEDVEAKLTTIEVVAGDASIINVESIGETSILGVGQTSLSFTIRDQYSNLLPDGTGVSFTVGNNLVIHSLDAAITNGKANIVVKGSEHEGLSSVTLNIQGISETVNVDVQPLSITSDFNGLLTVQEQEDIVLTVNDAAGNPVANVDVLVGASFAYLNEDILTTDSKGEILVKLTAPNAKGEGTFTAQLGRLEQLRIPFTVNYRIGEVRDLEVDYASMIGDQTSAANFSYQRYDNTNIDVPYQVQRTIKALGSEGDVVDVSIGDMHDANRQLLAAYAMGEVDQGFIHDNTGRASLTAANTQSQFGTRLGAGKSLSFTASNNSELTLATAPLLNKNSDIGFSIEVLPKGDPAGQLINLGKGAQTLELNDQSQLVYQVRTDAGLFSLTSDAVFQNRWHQVAGRYYNGQLELSVNGVVKRTAINGDIHFDPSADDLVVGKGFTGQLNSLKWIDWSSQPVMTFADGSTTKKVTIGATGSTDVIIKSAGNFRNTVQGSISSLDIQRVLIHTRKTKQYASLISLEGFGRIAQQYTDTVSTTAPAINLAALQSSYSQNAQGAYASNYQSNLTLAGVNLSLIPQAHAGSISDFLMSTVEFLLPLESLNVIANQISILADGGEVDGVKFMLAIMDVLTYFPPARPLQLLLKPLKGLAYIMPRKFRDHFIGALGGIANKARKGDFDTLWNVLPFLIVAAEMYHDPDTREGIEFLMSTVNSSEDVLNWIDYLGLPAGGWVGDTLPEIDPFAQPEQTTQLFSNPFIASAYAGPKAAAFRVSSKVIAASLKQAKKRFTGEMKENLPRALGHLAKSLKDVDAASLRKHVFSPRLWLASTAVLVRNGKHAMIQFLKGKTNARYKPAAIMAITAYLEWEASCGKALDIISGEKKKDGAEFSPEEKAEAQEAIGNLECGTGESGNTGIRGGNNRRELYNKFKVAFKDTTSGKFKEEIDDDVYRENEENYILGGGGHGALFHMAQIARYQMLHRAGGEPIKAIEGFRRVWLYSDEGKRDDAETQESQDEAKSKNQIAGAYSRYVDLIIGEKDKPEQWIELKSFSQRKNKPTKIDYLQGKNIKRWNLQKKAPNAMSLHRQYSLDRAAAHVKHARLAADPDNNKRNKVVDVSSDFLWLFQKFDIKWTPKSGPLQHVKSVELGSKSVAGSVRGNLAKPLANSDTKGRRTAEVRKANMGDAESNTDKHIDEADAKQLLQDLVSIGFSEALDDFQVN